MKNLIALSVMGIAAFAGSANAGLILETESNNTAATANFIGTFNTPGGSILIDGTITPGTAAGQGGVGQAGDVDWFRFTVGGTSTVVASIFSLNNQFADSELWLVGGDGTTIIRYNDDGNPGGGSPNTSSLIQANLTPGDYYLAISGWRATLAGQSPDGNANRLPDGYAGSTQINGHNQNFDYKFIVGLNVVPTPGAAALMGLGGLAMARRRR